MPILHHFCHIITKFSPTFLLSCFQSLFGEDLILCPLWHFGPVVGFLVHDKCFSSLVLISVYSDYLISSFYTQKNNFKKWLKGGKIRELWVNLGILGILGKLHNNIALFIFLNRSMLSGFDFIYRNIV